MIENYQKLEKRVAELEERLRRIENRNRGYLTQSAAAQYLGRSKEYLRDRHANGTGPARMPNGQYAIRDLDEWMQQEATKPNVYINPKAPHGLKRLLNDVFPDANKVTGEEMEERLDKALQGKRDE